jgi:hypothetical protein
MVRPKDLIRPYIVLLYRGEDGELHEFDPETDRLLRDALLGKGK